MGSHRRLGDADCLVSWHFVSQSLRFRGVVNQANTSRLARLYELARRTRRVCRYSAELYGGYTSVKDRYLRPVHLLPVPNDSSLGLRTGRDLRSARTDQISTRGFFFAPFAPLWQKHSFGGYIFLVPVGEKDFESIAYLTSIDVRHSNISS